jgi:hypothetical protein
MGHVLDACASVDACTEQTPRQGEEGQWEQMSEGAEM